MSAHLSALLQPVLPMHDPQAARDAAERDAWVVENVLTDHARIAARDHDLRRARRLVALGALVARLIERRA